jgi:hypothetical protein
MENFEEFARQRLDHNRQRLALKEQQEQRLTLAYAGGMFLVTTELMALLATWPENDILYLVDSYENPVEIVDATDMLVACRQRWYEVMNDWHNQYQELKKVRRVGQLNE